MPPETFSFRNGNTHDGLIVLPALRRSVRHSFLHPSKVLAPHATRDSFSFPACRAESRAHSGVFPSANSSFSIEFPCRRRCIVPQFASSIWRNAKACSQGARKEIAARISEYSPTECLSSLKGPDNRVFSRNAGMASAEPGLNLKRCCWPPRGTNPQGSFSVRGKQRHGQ